MIDKKETKTKGIGMTMLIIMLRSIIFYIVTEGREKNKIDNIKMNTSFI